MIRARSQWHDYGFVAGRTPCNRLRPAGRWQLSYGWFRAALIVGLAVALPGASAGAQQETLGDTLARAGAYVQDYQRRMTTIIAEEHYVQHSVAEDGGAVEARTLRSEFMLLPGMPDEAAWFAFRDVFEVDGRPVESRRGRLEGWLRESRSGFMRRARALALEQARYNIGPIVRTINVPTLALEILTPANQARFRFRRTGTARLEEREVTVVSFEERRRGTMIRTPEGKDIRARGTLWIETATGRVRRTELRTRGPGQIDAAIDVRYAFVLRLDMLLPSSMAELYVGRGARITGNATYGNYRRFETDVRIVR